MDIILRMVILLKEDRFHKVFMWLGETKCKAYCFGYIFAYVVGVFTMVFRRGDTSWGAFNPLRLVFFFLAYMTGTMVFGIVHKYDINRYRIKFYFLGFVLVLVTIVGALLDKNYHLGLSNFL